MYCRKRSIGQSDNSLATLLGKKVHAKLREVVNTHAEMQVEKCIQYNVWLLSHVIHTNAVWTVCAQQDGSMSSLITMRWFQSIRTCPYSWAAGRNTSKKILHWTNVFYSASNCKIIVNSQPMKCFKYYKGAICYIYDIKFGMLQVRENEISLCKWSAGTAHLRTSNGTLVAAFDI